MTSAFLLVATCGSYSSHLIFSLSSCSRVTDSALSICGIEAATPIEFHRPVYRLEQMLTTSGADLWPVRSVAAASRELHEIIDLATPLPGGTFVYRFVIQTGSRKKFDRDAREAHAGRYAGTRPPPRVDCARLRSGFRSRSSAYPSLADPVPDFCRARLPPFPCFATR
jgi:hypothetical protein